MDIPARASTKTASGQVVTGAGVLKGAALCAGADAATATFYDGTSNAGILLGKLGAAANTSAPVLNVPVEFESGLYVEITGTTPKAIAYL